ncbi:MULTISPECIES: YlxR family protein [Isoptericola]|uniref:YlxR family protein n=1 Tax=Isoptericola TaxID=254250 RepID=UPI00280B8432|nr:YlxR family protein [Isoptericola halotolerans]
MAHRHPLGRGISGGRGGRVPGRGRLSWSRAMTSRVRLTGTGPRALASARPHHPSPPTAGPVRTCVGCRARDLRSDLLRLVIAASDDASRTDVRVVVDVRGSLPGRGAWIHPDLACLEGAVRRRAVPRALRAAAPLDLSAVRAHLEQQDR